MPSDVPFHLGRDDTGPVQQSPVTCGSASLTVARMLASPAFAAWIVSGTDPEGGPADPRSEPERFAESERQVMKRTNGLHAAGGALNVPWPQRYGTPPWGAEKELENLLPGVRAAYRLHVVRFGSAATRRDAYQDLVRLVRPGRPALLYIGSSQLPRHVTLLLPHGGSAGPDAPGGDDLLDVYDPATGSVTGLSPDSFAGGTLGIAGWDVPWVTVQPRSR